MMARYRLILPVAGAAPRGQYGQYNIGTVIVDSEANALSPADVVWPAIALNPSPAMQPLDAEGLALIQRNNSGNRGHWPNSISS
jgi:hypothetical protein